MSNEVERFLQAEEVAVKLAETLKQLHNEAVSYHTATDELSIAREELLKLIESTGKVMNGVYDVIKVLKEIGSMEILSKLAEMESKSAEEFTKQSRSINKLKVMVIAALACSIGTLAVSMVMFLR